MADKIHKKKKDWPHFDKLYLGSSAYAEGYDRIFGKGKNEKTSGIQKRSEKHSEEAGDKHEEGGSNTGLVHKKSKRKGKAS